jgi:hypothetical protein
VLQALPYIDRLVYLSVLHHARAFSSIPQENKSIHYIEPLKIDTSYSLPYSFIAGLVDGDGSCKNGATTGEIRVSAHVEDLPLLSQLFYQLGGEIRLDGRKNNRGIYISLNNTNCKHGAAGFRSLILNLNGHIRNTVRVAQFKKLCSILNIYFQKAPTLTSNCGYIAGYFTADGSAHINYTPSAVQKTNKKNGGIKETKRDKLINGVAPKVVLSFTNKFICNLKSIIPAFQNPLFPDQHIGQIRETQGSRPDLTMHRLEINKKQCVLTFVEYLKRNPSLSIKNQRMLLIDQFFALKSEKAYLKTSSASLNAQWVNFCKAWYPSND